MLEIFAALGGTVSKVAPNEYALTMKDVTRTDIPVELSRKIRASILFAGPLLARFGKVTTPPPGGDVIGRRRIDTHVLAFEDLGARLEIGRASCRERVCLLV